MALLLGVNPGKSIRINFNFLKKELLEYNMRYIIILLLIFRINVLLAEDTIDKGFLQITTIKEIMNNMVEKYEKIRTYRANFYMKSIIDKVESLADGEMKYRAPDTFIMIFKHPADQIIFSDGNTLKLFIPELNVVGEQNLTQYRPGFLISGKTSLYYLRNKFNFSFYKSNKPEIINEMPYHVLLLTQNEVTAGFKNIILHVSQYWIITKVKATTLNGNEIELRFSNITVNKKITDHEFEFNLPISVQTIKNPLFFKFEGD